MRIPLIKSTFYKEDETKKALCSFIIEAKQLSMSAQCVTFEKSFARWQGRKYCVTFNSGSSANLALIQALQNMEKLSVGDTVGFSAITWATNVMPIIQCQLTPMPIDIEINTLNVSPRTLQDALATTHIKTLFLTNLLGFSDDIASIKEICNKKDILLIEDNCESLGSEFNNVKLGNYGFASTFSFFVGHHMSTIEGGAICTDDKKLYETLLMVRSHGWDRHLDTESQIKLREQFNVDDFYGKYTFYNLAFNLRPTEITGFLGNYQLQFLDEMIDRREKNYEKLSLLYTNPAFAKIENMMSRNSNFAFPLIAKNKRIKEKYLKKCTSSGIEIRPIVGGLMTNQPFYTNYTKNLKKNTHALPNAQYIHDNGFYFGNNPELTDEEISTLLETFL